MYFVAVHFPYQNDLVLCPAFASEDDAHDFRIAMNRCLPKHMKRDSKFWCENEVFECDCCKKV